MIFFLFFLSVFCIGYTDYTVNTLCDSPRIYYVENFLSYEECDYFMKLARPYLVPSTVINNTIPDKRDYDPRRTSFEMFFSPYLRDKKIAKVEKRIQYLTGFPIECGEEIQVVQYKKGGEYQPHFDYFDPSTKSGESYLKRGGQRVATVIMYLNTPKKGGETVFPRAQIRVTPKKGSAVFFYNCLPSGDPDPLSFHGGAVVIEGEKWIATKWIRESTFR